MPDEIKKEPTSITELEPKMHLKGKVTHTELYGAFVDIGVECDGLVHISQLSEDRVKKVTDVVEEGDEVKVWVLDVKPEQGRIALTMVEPPEVSWSELAPGQVREGTVVRMERYGAFVDVGAVRPGLLHVKEMGDYVRDPSDIVRRGDTIEVKILKVDSRKRQIDLSLNIEEEIDLDDDMEEFLSPMEVAFQQAQSESRRQKKSKARNARRDDKERDEIYQRTLQHGK
jgi:ribosomal protein S1